MIFNIDTAGSVPIYAQIVAQVKHGIAGRLLRPGDALPSLREMSARLRVNPLTVRRAYQELEMEGIVVTEHGRGTHIGAKIRKLGKEYRREALTQAVDQMLVEAHHLGATRDDVRDAVEDRLRVMHEPHSDTEAKEVKNRHERRIRR